MKSTKWELEDAENYRKSERPSNSLVDFIQQSPLASIELDLVRDKSPARDFSL